MPEITNEEINQVDKKIEHIGLDLKNIPIFLKKNKITECDLVKEYRDYVLEQLSLVPGISCRPMMGEFLLYADGVLFGGIYDNRLLVKKTKGNSGFGMSEALPYEGTKPMYLVDEVDNKERLKEIVEGTVNDLL